jgi:hypothetical protein
MPLEEENRLGILSAFSGSQRDLSSTGAVSVVSGGTGLTGIVEEGT